MKCTNKFYVLLNLTFLILMLSGCSTMSFRDNYDDLKVKSAYSFEKNNTENIALSFASDICVVSGDEILTSVDMSTATAAGLFDVNNQKTIYAKNVHKQMNPASLTKTMTALIALKYGQLDDTLTASANVHITESGAQLLGIKEGDRMTLDQALHALLMYSANDAAIMIAEYISGSVEEFANLMNQEALSIGATNTHFMNPHGLTADEHYTTAYDLYLIFNEAMKYDKFKEIIHMTDYSSAYADRDGNIKNLDFKSTNRFINGDLESPNKVNVIGGKTGTTNAAGSCLILLSNDASGNPFISVVLQANDRDSLYSDMVDLLEEIK